MVWYKIENNQNDLIVGNKYILCDEDFTEVRLVTYKSNNASWERTKAFIDNEDYPWVSDGQGLFVYMIPLDTLTSDQVIVYNDPTEVNNDIPVCFACQNYLPK